MFRVFSGLDNIFFFLQITPGEAVVNSRTSKVPCLMFLLRKLFFAAARSNFTFAAQHVPRIHNTVADALSRFHWQEFRRLAPEAHPVPVDIPQSLLEDLIHPLSRGSRPPVLDGGVSLVHQQQLLFGPEEVRGILHTAGRTGPSQVSVPRG